MTGVDPQAPLYNCAFCGDSQSKKPHGKTDKKLRPYLQPPSVVLITIGVKGMPADGVLRSVHPVGHGDDKADPKDG